MTTTMQKINVDVSTADVFGQRVLRMVRATTKKLIDQKTDSATRLSTVRRLDKYIQVWNLLVVSWQQGGCRFTEGELAEQCPLLGCHKVHEVRVPEERQDESTKRKVREIIEDLRKDYSAPILSTPATGQRGANTAGYWIVRAEDEINEYITRKDRERKAAYLSGIATDDAMRTLFGRKDFPFAAVKIDLEAIVLPEALTEEI